MIKKMYLTDGKFAHRIHEKKISFKECVADLKDWLFLNSFKEANIKFENALKNGVSMTFNNHINISGDILKQFDDTYILEFKEFTHAIAFNEHANITMDFLQNRIFFEDYNLTIYFIK